MSFSPMLLPFLNVSLPPVHYMHKEHENSKCKYLSAQLHINLSGAGFHSVVYEAEYKEACKAACIRVSWVEAEQHFQ